MTYPDDRVPEPKSSKGKTIAYILLAIVGFGGFAYLAYTLYSTGYNDIEPRINSNFTDSNQTRADLLKIIENQRLAVYSSYPLEWAFCESKLDGSIVSAERSDVKVQGQTITETMHCENQTGVKVVYDIIFNQVTNEYKESIRFPGV